MKLESQGLSPVHQKIDKEDSLEQILDNSSFLYQDKLPNSYYQDRPDFSGSQNLHSNSISQKNKVSVLSTTNTEIMSNFDDFLSCSDKGILFSSFCIEDLGEIFRVAMECRDKYVGLVNNIDQYLLSVRVTISKKLDQSRLIEQKLSKEMLQMGHYGLPKFNPIGGGHLSGQNVNGLQQGYPCNGVGFPGLPSDSPVLDPRYANTGSQIGDPFKITFGSQNHHNPQNRKMTNSSEPIKPIQIRASGSNGFSQNSGKRCNLTALKKKSLNTTATSASTKKISG